MHTKDEHRRPETKTKSLPPFLPHYVAKKMIQRKGEFRIRKRGTACSSRRQLAFITPTTSAAIALFRWLLLTVAWSAVPFPLTHSGDGVLYCMYRCPLLPGSKDQGCHVIDNQGIAFPLPHPYEALWKGRNHVYTCATCVRCIGHTSCSPSTCQ